MATRYRSKSRGDPAALVQRTYECPACEARFIVYERRDEHPVFCLKCGTGFEEEPEAIPGTHAIGGSAAARAVDFTYDQLVAAGAARAELTGNPGLKINDMRDNCRVGDIAAKSANTSPEFNAFTRAAAQAGQALPGGMLRYGFIGGGAGPGTAQPRVGPMMPGPGGPNSWVGPGHIAMHAFQQVHDRNIEVVRAGGLRAKGT